MRKTVTAWLASAWLDGQRAVRRLMSPRSGLIAVAGVLGLAIGITTSMFTIADSLFLRPVPFDAPDQLAILHMRGPMGGPRGVPPSVLRAWQGAAMFEDVEAARQQTVLVETDAGPIKRAVALVTPGVFHMLGGVRPVRGRLFDKLDSTVGDRVLISEDVWRAFFNAEPGLVGRVINVSGHPATVVGILPSAFHFPERNTAIWQASRFDTPEAELPRNRPIAYVRFKPHVPRPDVLRFATAGARQAAPQYHSRWADAVPLAETDLDYRRTLPLFAGGVILIFVGLCANASSLLLVGLTARGREFETRVALGASRVRLVQQALFESAATCVASVIVGIGLACALIAMARVVLPSGLLRQSLNSVDVDMRALAVTSVAAVAALLAAGVLPAVSGTRIQSGVGSQCSMRSGTHTKRGHAIRCTLTGAQIAISCTLLVVAALLVHSFVKLMTQDRGVDTSGVLVATVRFPQDTFATQAARTTVANRIVEVARAFPGVRRTSWSYGVPPDGGVRPTGSWVPDSPTAQTVEMDVTQFAIDQNFVALYGLTILSGRALDRADPPDSVLISESFAHRLWPHGDAVGRTVDFRNRRLGTHRTFGVVGIVREVRNPSLDRTLEAPQLYAALREVGVLGFLSIRCDSSCPDATLLERRLAESGAIIDGVQPLENKYVGQVEGPRAAATLAWSFALTALMASAAGLFALLSYNVGRRRREFGIRMALGAPPSSIRRLVWRETLTVAVPGVAVGALAGLLLTRLLSSMLFEVRNTDPSSWLAVVGVLAVTVMAASWRPIQTAISGSPMRLLSED
jgi:putative ABC transport system permease protein